MNGAGCLFVPELSANGSVVVCAPARYVVDCVQGLLRNLREYRGWVIHSTDPDVAATDPVDFPCATVKTDADGVRYVVDLQDLLVRVRARCDKGKDICAAVWVPGTAKIGSGVPDTSEFDVIFLLVNTTQCRMRRTQQEHFFSHHPSGKFRIAFTDDIAMRPRVPFRALPPRAQRHVRILDTDAARRNCSEDTTHVEALLHGRFVSVRSVR